MDQVRAWVSPVVLVPKPTGGTRSFVDMRQANMVANREWYSILTIDEFLQYLNQNKYFSKLDLNSSYHQIEWPLSQKMSPHSVPMMACTDTNDMFGICCEPEMYQKSSVKS